MPITSTPLRYPGGKSQLRPFVRELLLYDDFYPSVYFEPFCGGAGIAIDLLISSKVDEIILNDADRGIFSFWYAVLNDVDRFCSVIESTIISVEEWRKQREIYRSLNDSCTKKKPVVYDFDLAFATFFLNRTNVSGVIEGGCIGGLQQTGKYRLDARFNKINLIKKIEKINSHKERISLFGMDGLELLDFFASGEMGVQSDNVLSFIDPPYVAQGKNLYLNFFSLEDHRRLSDLLLRMTDYRWILTYDDCEYVRKIYSEFDMRSLNVRYSANRRMISSEIIVLSPFFKKFSNPLLGEIF